ncbi:hypothetical protein QTP88_012768 [Uroleucon formosanum]
MDDRRCVYACRVSYLDCTAALTCPLTSSTPSPTPPSQQQPQPSNGAPRSRDLGPILVGSGGGGGAASGASSVFICTGGLAGPANCRGTVVVPTATVVSYYNCCVFVLRVTEIYKSPSSVCTLRISSDFPRCLRSIIIIITQLKTTTPVNPRQIDLATNFLHLSTSSQRRPLTVKQYLAVVSEVRSAGYLPPTKWARNRWRVPKFVCCYRPEVCNGGC